MALGYQPVSWIKMMRWLATILFHVGVWLSVLLLLIVIAVGVRSFFAKDVLRWDEGDSSYGVSTALGRVAVSKITIPGWPYRPPGPPGPAVGNSLPG